jgi:hypothetical protein
MAVTYEPIATTNGSGSSASVTFSSITGAYTDLVLVVSGTLTTGGDSGIELRFNGTGAGNNDYSGTLLNGTGGVVSGSNQNLVASANSGLISSTAVGNSVMQIMGYSNTTTYKTVLGRGNIGSYIRATVYLYRQTTAITQIEVRAGNNFSTTTTFTLYGIKAA